LKKLLLYLQELRAPFFTASIVPVLLGASVAWYHTHQFHWMLFWLALAGGVLLHAGTNVINDFFDHRNKDDEVNVDYVRPFTGGSRFIQKGLLTPKEVLWESIIAYIAAFCIGLALFTQRGYPILILGAIGLFCGLFYVGPPIMLVSRGIGELIVGINFGVLMTLGSYFVQTGRFSLEAALASGPVALLIFLVLFINQFQDMKADSIAGKRNLVVRMGRRRSSRVYVGVLVLAYVWILVFVGLRLISPFALLCLLSVPVAVKSAGAALVYYDQPKALVPANAGTIVTHLLMGLLMSLAYLLDGLLS
jgi:1,4-dihydroxy-2-naphthoate octaprenyltransferase